MAIRATESNRNVADCPICGVSVARGDDFEEGELIECRECGTELEVKTVDPFALVEAPQEEEDWGQ